MNTRLIDMTAEFLSLRDAINKLTKPRVGAEEDAHAIDHEALMEPLVDRMASLAQRIGRSHARTPEELAQKARVALDCIDENGDTSDAQAASLGRDVLSLFARDSAGAIRAIDELRPKRLAAVGR